MIIVQIILIMMIIKIIIIMMMVDWKVGHSSEEALVYESFPSANIVRRLFSRRGCGKWKTALKLEKMQFS